MHTHACTHANTHARKRYTHARNAHTHTHPFLVLLDEMLQILLDDIGPNLQAVIVIDVTRREVLPELKSRTKEPLVTFGNPIKSTLKLQLEPKDCGAFVTLYHRDDFRGLC